MKKICAIILPLFLSFYGVSQSLVSINPAVANTGQTLNVTITGTNTHFIQASSTTSIYFSFQQTSATIVNSMSIVNDSSLQANITIPTNIVTGDYNVTVANSAYGSLSLNNSFHVNSVTSPSLVSISPASANTGQTLNVTITGANTHFAQVAANTVGFSFSQTSATTIVNTMNVLNDTSIQANISIPSNVITGDYHVYVNNSTDGIVTLYNGFHVNGNLPPSLVSINPDSATVGQTLNVTITGVNTHFAQVVGNNVNFSFTQTSGTTVVNSVNVIDDNSLQANITIPPNVLSGNYNVSVSNTIDGPLYLNNSFHVNGVTPGSLVSVNPAGAQAGQTLNVTITGAGTHFSQGSGATVEFTFSQTSGTTVVPFVNNFSIVNDTSIIANITIPSSATLGNYGVRVFNNIDGYMYSNFNVYSNCFSHYTTSYNSSNNQFTLALDSITVASAISYYWDFGDGATSTLQTPSHSFVQDTTYNVCLTIKTSAVDSCTYCHVIGKDTSGIVLKQLAGFSLNVVFGNGTVLGTTEISKNVIGLSVMAFPNPANDVVTISIDPSVKLNNTMFSIFAIDGKLMLQKSIDQINTDINIKDFSSGIYFVKMTSNEKVQVIKFVKQ